MTHVTIGQCGLEGGPQRKEPSPSSKPASQCSVTSSITIGGDGQTRTDTACATDPSNLRVYQFRHIPTKLLYQTAAIVPLPPICHQCRPVIESAKAAARCPCPCRSRAMSGPSSQRVRPCCRSRLCSPRPLARASQAKLAASVSSAAPDLFRSASWIVACSRSRAR